MSDSKPESGTFAPSVPLPAARRRRLLTLGNTTAYEIGRRLSIGWEHTHIRNASWPSLGGAPMTLRAEMDAPVFQKIRRTAVRECDKTVVQDIRSMHWDVLLMSTAAQVGAAFMVLGEAVIPDFTVPPWLPETLPAGVVRPDIRRFVPEDARRVTWRDGDFLALAKAGFDRAYANALKRRIRAGAHVFVYRQRPAQWVLTPEGIARAETPDAAEADALSAALAEHAATFPGVTVIDTLETLNFTSDDAAGGRGPLNPIDEQFVQVASVVARAMNDPLADDVVAHHLLEMRRERIAVEWAASGDRRERERDLEAVIRALIERSALLEREMLATKRTLSWRITRPLRAVRRLGRRG